MDQQVQVVIVKVTSKTINGRNGAFTKFEIEANDGRTYQTTKREIAELAHAKQGQNVTIGYYTKENNGYTNYILTSVGGGAAQGGGIPSADASQAGIPAQAQESPSETRESIHRQVAAKVAAQLSQTPQEFWGNVTDLKRFFDTGEVPGAQAAGGSAAAPIDDDIPFAPSIY